MRGLLHETEQTFPPTDLRLLASFRRIGRIEEVRMKLAGYIGFDREVQRSFIQINVDHSAGKRRFSAAHEIVHTLMPSWQSGGEHSDGDTGLYLHLDGWPLKEHQEREVLCDHGAAAILYPSDWFRGNIDTSQLSISHIRNLAEACDSSLDSAAFQLSQHHLGAAAVVFWEPRYRKADEPKTMMAPLPGFRGSIELKYRVTKVYPSPVFRAERMFIPLNKSTPQDSIVSQCERSLITSGKMQLDLGSRIVEYWSENYFAPYGTQSRIISVLRPA